jgi:hypothetical protein
MLFVHVNGPRIKVLGDYEVGKRRNLTLLRETERIVRPRWVRQIFSLIRSRQTSAVRQLGLRASRAGCCKYSRPSSLWLTSVAPAEIEELTPARRM